jgi:predicted AAA+ superfamily ATPase
MKPIARSLEKEIIKRIGSNKVILLFGSRRVGKTKLLHSIAAGQKQPPLILNGEDLDVQQLLARRTVANYGRIIGNNSLIMIDEAQNVPDIGKHLKFMIDSFPKLTIIATGSSSFDLMNKSGEPLTGRNFQYTLYPIAQDELMMSFGALETKQQFDERLIFGSYPEVINIPEIHEKELYLKSLVQNYLLKDIFIYENIKNSSKIFDLLKLLAFQVGSEVSIEELGRNLGMSKNTVERYLDLLSKVFIIFKVGGFSSNLRKEVVKSNKWYFMDNGIRNAIISDFRTMDSRNDKGQLWENFCFYERMKFMHYGRKKTEYFFWRTYDKQEIDMIEKNNTQLHAFEFKWSDKSMKKIPRFFASNYPDSGFDVVHPANYLEFTTS